MKFSLLLQLLACGLLVVSCASNRTNLVARTSGEPLRADLRNISLMPRQSSTPAERALDESLAAELRRRGIAIVAQGESDFTLSVNVEENWDTLTRNEYPHVITTPSYSTAGTSQMFVLSEPDLLFPEKVETHIRTEGIRLRLYDTRAVKQGRFVTTWEGYIEAGLRMRPEQPPQLLRMLLDYLGKDFIGRVKIPK